MMDEITQNIVLDAVYACPDPQVHNFFRQLMLEKDNIFLVFALERTLAEFKEVFLVQLGKEAEIQYTSQGVPVVRPKHKLSE